MEEDEAKLIQRRMKNGPESRAPTDSVSLEIIYLRLGGGGGCVRGAKTQNRNEQSNSCMGHASPICTHTLSRGPDKSAP